MRISIDSKAKVKIGPFSRGGRSGGLQSLTAADHDMGYDALLVPLGILEIGRGEQALDQLWIGFGQSRETLDFVVDAMERWWKHQYYANALIPRRFTIPGSACAAVLAFSCAPITGSKDFVLPRIDLRIPGPRRCLPQFTETVLIQKKQPDDQRPHIVFIITDQQRYDTIAELGYAHVDTPHLDRLVREGTSLDQCHVTAASCAAARASLFKGYYPHTTGILKNADTWRRSWIERLNESGYYCTNIGKMHTWPFQTELGFHERFVVENKDRYLEGRYFFDEWDRALRYRGIVKQQRATYRQRDDYRETLGAFEWNLPEDTHPDVFVGDMATWWIDTKPRVEPLFLQIGFPGPHPPYDPIPRYAKPYLDRDLPLLPVTQTELDGLPPALKELRQHNQDTDHDSIIMDLNPTQQQRHRQRAYYLANITMIDEKVGQIIDSLDRNGYLDNAIVIFTSDHGDCLSDHGQSQKWTMYDQITRVPMIVWSPSGKHSDRPKTGTAVPRPSAQGRRVDSLVQQMDIGPTILHWAGLEVPGDWEAKSLIDAFDPQTDFVGRPYVYCEQSGDAVLTGCQFMTMVRDRKYKLVHFLDEPDGQLFDLTADPDEVVNLWNEPSADSAKKRLLDELREWRIRSGLHTKNWCKDWR